MTFRRDDSAIADAFYTVVSIGLVMVVGITVSMTVLSITSQEAKKASDRMTSFINSDMKKGVYAFYYECDACDAGEMSLKRLACERVEPAVMLDRTSGYAPQYHGTVIWAGYLYVENEGDYAFQFEGELWIDGAIVDDTIRLTQGYHPVKARFSYMKLYGTECALRWDASGQMSTIESLYR